MPSTERPRIEFTAHALAVMRRRRLAPELIAHVVQHPDQRIRLRPEREVLQSRVWLGTPAKVYLVRVFVDVHEVPPRVVTAYRTSRIAKYWRLRA